MNSVSTGKIIGGLGLALLAGLVVLALNVNVAPQNAQDGIDVRNTKCEEIASARDAIATELAVRKDTAQNERATSREAISDAYWSVNQKLEANHHACISVALSADPCKESFEEVGKIYEEIMADFDAGKGFNEVKFKAREEAKARYNKCVDDARKPEFYKEKEEQCDQALAVGREANQTDRTQKEAGVESVYAEAIARAENLYREKSAILDAIEAKCNEPGGISQIRVGGVTTETSGTTIDANSPSCTGVFDGNDPEIRKRIAELESQLQKAKAAGLSDGLFGTQHIQSSLDDLRQELKDSGRTCKVDADCGDPAPVCCSGNEVGRSYCDAGVCAFEKKTCTDPEICAGKPAMCVAPSTGVKQGDGISITRTIPEIGSCSQNLQVLTLAQATKDSVHYAIVGNIPSWLHIDKPDGILPGKVNVTYSCGTVQGFGAGTYTVSGSITVYNGANEHINTIPLNVAITVTPAPSVMIDAIEYNGKFLPVAQLKIESEEGCTAKHWHATNGAVTATDGTIVQDPGPQCGYGKTSERPVIKAPEKANSKKGETKFEVRGLEGLKMSQ